MLHFLKHNLNIKVTVQAIIFLFCLSVVIYESTKCIQEYFAYPTASEVKVELATSQSFPQITLCPTIESVRGANRSYYNETHLKECGLRFDTLI